MMEEAGVDTSPGRYRAFISYSHADSRFAAWLHRRLEAWTIPGQGRLTPIFIDRAELAAGPDLSASVREALAASAALIVIASPAARASPWVTQEVSLFRELHPGRPVLAALLDGEPGEAFPEPLLSRGGQSLEPLAADFRERRDGKRLALLKIVAGLTAQPLDRLVQRDAQARQRRVMWITAGALVLSLVLAAMLVVALRARSEADRQRAEAEGMVEFMLTDLRDKLKGVGRLDVMDAVNQRAMAHYANDKGNLSDSETLRRAKLVQTMGADDLDRAGVDPAKSAFRARAAAEFALASSLTGGLQRREPNNPSVVFAVAQSEFYLGLLYFTPKFPNGPRDLANTRIHWQAYLDLARRLVKLESGNLKWSRELGFAHGSLCSLNLQDKRNPVDALAACHDASETMKLVYERDGRTLQGGIDYANRLGWESDAALAAGNAGLAISLRRGQLSLTAQFAATNPSDARALNADMLSQMGAAKMFQSVGQNLEAIEFAEKAMARATTLAQLDPENSAWRARMKQIQATRSSIH